MRLKKRSIPYFLIALVVILLVLRLFLPSIVKSYVNNALQDIPDYRGYVEDIDIALIRGAYTIKGLVLNRVQADTETDFLNFPQTDISVEWRSLLKGKIVSEIIMTEPQLTYVFEDQQQDSTAQDASTDDWTKVLKDLVPIDINHLEINNGKLGFVQLQADPNIDLYMNNVQLSATNLRNVDDKSVRLPSEVHATAVSIGDGNMTLDAKANVLKPIPDMDLNFKLQSVRATALNDLTKHYSGVDFEKGTFELFGEMAIKDSQINGYIKPFFKDVKIIDSFKKENSSIFKKAWEGLVSLVGFTLKNQWKDQTATKIPIRGSLDNVKTGILPSVFGIFKNAFVKAYDESIDQEINFDGKKKDKKDKKEKKNKE